jgi:hypothetical protein
MSDYGTVAEVVALTRMYLQGQATYNTTTRPTGAEVDTMMNRASGMLNVALANAGFDTPVTATDPKLLCDEWVVNKTAQMIEVSQPVNREEQANRRAELYASMAEEATKFVEMYAVGLQNLAVSKTRPEGEAMIFTGQDAQAHRADPDNTALEQPFFSRRRFDA